jgi:hypothetical protein
VSRRRITWCTIAVSSDRPINAKVPNKRNGGGGFGASGITCALREERREMDGCYLLRDMRTRTAQDYVNYASRCGAPALCQDMRVVDARTCTRAGDMLV